MHLVPILLALIVGGFTIVLAVGQAQNAHMFTWFQRVETICVGLLAIAIILGGW